MKRKVDLAKREADMDELPVKLLAFAAVIIFAGHVCAQPAPLPSREVPYEPTERTMSPIPSERPGAPDGGFSFTFPSLLEEQIIRPFFGGKLIKEEFTVPDAPWLQLYFSGFNLGKSSTLMIQSSLDGERQIFDHDSLTRWGGYTGIFNGDTIELSLVINESDENVTYGHVETIAGEFIKRNDDPEQIDGDRSGGRAADGAQSPGGNLGSEQVCGTKDDRSSSSDRRIGRTWSLGCTAFLVEGGVMVTAGHCVFGLGEVVHFNVPLSSPIGLPVAALKRDEYKIILPVFATHNDDVEDPDSIDPHPRTGNDWTVFVVEPNLETGLAPADAQGASFQVSCERSAGDAQVTGFGIDDNPISANQAQQTSRGKVSEPISNGIDDMAINHFVDTRVGNSGSPIITVVDGVERAVGIHEWGQCNPQESSPNIGTSFCNEMLAQAIKHAIMSR